MSASLSSHKPRCRFFGACGGCATQDIPYEQQLERKAARSRAALAAGGFDGPVPIHPSPDTWFYRNKMEFSFGLERGPDGPLDRPKLHLGLKPKGRWYEVLDLTECFLLSEETPALLEGVRAWARINNLLPYNSRRNDGQLRHLVVRETKNGTGRLVLLVAAPGPLPRSSFLEAVQKSYPATTILLGINGKLSDTAVSDTLETLSGEGFITETLRFPGRKLHFRISPPSFFQTNTRATELLYGILRAWMEELRPKTALDLYCGGGGIGLSLADRCGRVVGVEQNPSAVADARANAAANGIVNIEFETASIESFSSSIQCPDALIIDPPRAGLHPKALRTLLQTSAPDLFYVSCNPEALARDLILFKDAYAVARAEAVDLFPHTEQVETAVWLKARNAN